MVTVAYNLEISARILKDVNWQSKEQLLKIVSVIFEKNVNAGLIVSFQIHNTMIGLVEARIPTGNVSLLDLSTEITTMQSSPVMKF